MTQRLSRSLLRAACTVLMVAATMPVRAATSDALVTEGGSIRLVAAAPDADGRIPAVLDIRLNPGWKTYWRDPGASGIPPSVSLAPDSGIRLDGIGFPAPERFDDGTLRTIGYDRPVALPLLLKRQGDPSTLAVSVFLGICREICIPVQGELRLTLDRSAQDHPLDRARIDAAQRALPEPPSAGFQLTESRIDAAGHRIDVRLSLPQGAGGEGGTPPELFVSGPAGFTFGQPEIVANKNGALAASIAVRHRPKDAVLTGRDVNLVVRAGDRSMETPLAFD